MPIDWDTGLDAETALDEEAMACAVPRIPLITPGTESEELKPLYEQSREMWGNVPRYLQLLAHAPGGVEAWNILDRELRLKRLATRPDYVRLEELVIIKTSLLNICNN